MIVADNSILANVAGLTELHALNPSIPTLKWTYAFKTEPHLITAANGVVYVSPVFSSVLYAVSNKTGELLWETGFEEEIQGIRVVGDVVVVKVQSQVHMPGNA